MTGPSWDDLWEHISPDAARWAPEDVDVENPNHSVVVRDPVTASLMVSAIRRTADYIADAYPQRVRLAWRRTCGDIVVAPGEHGQSEAT